MDMCVRGIHCASDSVVVFGFHFITYIVQEDYVYDSIQKHPGV